MSEWFESGKLVFPKEPNKNFILKKYKTELKSNFKPISSIIQGILTSSGTKELKSLFEDASPFKYPKPTELLKLLISQVTDNDDIVLDFFAGSGTTAQAVIDLNVEENTRRSFICVQMPEIYHSEDGELNHKYQFVSDVTKLRISKSINKHIENKAINHNTLNFRHFKLSPTQFKIWNQNIKGADEIKKQLSKLKETAHYVHEENLLYELILKSDISLTAKIIKYNAEFRFYLVENKYVFLLNEISLPLISFIIEQIKPSVVYCLDKLFNNNDSLKTNISLELKESSIKLITI